MKVCLKTQWVTGTQSATGSTFSRRVDLQVKIGSRFPWGGIQWEI